MRRKDRELSLPETEKILAAGIYGVLSINGQDDYAYGVPFSYVFTGGSIYMHSAVEGDKLTRLRRDNRVSFCVVGAAVPLVDTFCMQYESAMIFGTVHEVNGEEKSKALVLLARKYSTDEFIEKGRAYAADSAHRTVVLRLDIEHISGKARK
ncbi:MAG: pyridoxamine 5'-phosphate oxidase family protein [Syntrophobacteraceae bacterium]|nr:pyridoxamine 5'-phosphate oxidase family protein [Syntrophobacteraceae bacterium]